MGLHGTSGTILRREPTPLLYPMVLETLYSNHPQKLQVPVRGTRDQKVFIGHTTHSSSMDRPDLMRSAGELQVTSADLRLMKKQAFGERIMISLDTFYLKLLGFFSAVTGANIGVIYGHCNGLSHPYSSYSYQMPGGFGGPINVFSGMVGIGALTAGSVTLKRNPPDRAARLFQIAIAVPYLIGLFVAAYVCGLLPFTVMGFSLYNVYARSVPARGKPTGAPVPHDHSMGYLLWGRIHDPQPCLCRGSGSLDHGSPQHDP